ncbi:DUF262 domain-containing protein [Pendulispora albinea]|uniref:DUF262 domain-containing protein n=1 Tax=Pendulispora albinea TaxID=2741071 RepID=A0ABZ2M9F0_9BACT
MDRLLWAHREVWHIGGVGQNSIGPTVANPSRGSALHTPLDKPPSAFTLTVRKILNRVQAGEIRVPTFQRPLRWTAPDVLKLFDSILKGYPVGSLLFWKHVFAPDPALRIGNARIDAPAVPDGWYIVDGQQRITALAAALLDLDHGGDRRWTARFDPTSSSFLSGPAEPSDQRRHVPLSVLGDIRRLGKWFRECDLSDEEQNRVEEVQQRLLDYEVPAYLVESDDAEALRGIFARLNSTGARMRADEVFQALLGTGTPGERSPSRSIDLVALQQACDLDNFGQPPRGEVLKALLAMSGLDPTKRLEDLGEHVATELVSASEASEALQRTVAFLQTSMDAADPGAGIPAYDFVPYPVVFILLARWFHLFPEPDATTRKELSRWLWRAVVTGVHQRAEVSAMRYQIRAITGTMEDSLRKLQSRVPVDVKIEWSTLDPFHASHAASRVELLALLSRGPRDRFGPVSWRALISGGKRVAREIIRSSAWHGWEPESQRLARTAANRALLDARHTGLSVEFRRWKWEDDRDALESHLIDETGFKMLHDDPAAFLRHRGARVRTEVSKFLSQRVGLDEPRLFPAESYYETDDMDPRADTTKLEHS